MKTPRKIEIFATAAHRRPVNDLRNTIITLAQASPKYILRMLRDNLLVRCSVILLCTVAAHAQDAMWIGFLGNDWDAGFDWVGGTVPTGTATFGTSQITNLTFSSPTTAIRSIVINAGAPAYSFSVSGNSLDITGAGIGGVGSPTFNVGGTNIPGVLTINGTAANATIITNNNAATNFVGVATAGTANITTDGGGFTIFTEQSTAGTAIITTNGGGSTLFENNPIDGGGQARLITTPGGTVDISGLLSTGMTAGSIEGAGTYELGSKALTVGGNNLSTEVSGNIVDGGLAGGTGGSLIKVGTGTLTLSGVNTYSGVTTVSAGTLQAGSTTGFSSASAFTVNTTLDLNGFSNSVGSLAGTGTVTNHGGTAATLAVGGDGTDTVFSGALNDGTTATLGLIKTGTGTLTLAGASNYSGGTTITGGGTLSVGIDAALGAVSGGITMTGGKLLTTQDGFTSARLVTLSPSGNANTLVAANDTTATYTGIFSGDGALTVGDVVHRGTVVLASGANTYTGGTTVLSGGVLSVNTDAELGNASGGIILKSGGELLTTANFTSARSVSLNPESFAVVIAAPLAPAPLPPNILAAAANTTATYTGVVFGTGGLTVGDSTHAGTVVLAGNNTYSGGTMINLGTLLVDNAHALSTGDVTVNGGTLGADPQPINVEGNYTQSAAGTLQLGIAGRAAGQFDVLNVTGNAALNGTLQLLNLGYQPQGGDQLILINTGGVVSGRFSRFVSPFVLAPGFNTIDLVYARQSVTLEFLDLATPVVPPPPGTPGTPTVVVTTDFSSFAFTSNQSAAANLLDAVQLDPRAANLISFLTAEPFSNLPRDLQKISPDGLTAFYEIGFSNANIQKLTLEGRLDDLHNGSNGFTSNMSFNGATVNDKTGSDGKSSKAVMEPILQHAPENRWGVWVTGFGDFVNVDGDGNGEGYNFTTGGVSVGLDYRLTDQLAIGVFGDYSHTWTSLNPSGHLDVDSGRGGLYATWFSHGIYLNAAIYGGHNSYDSGRAGLGGLANGGTEGAEWSTFISGGYDFHFGRLTVGPIASLQYTDVGIDSFSEKGSLAPLAIHSDSAESLRSDAGFRLFYQWQIGKIIVEPSLKAAWEHEYKYSALPITAGFAGVPGPSATFFGPSEGHDSAVVSAEVSVQVTPAITTYVNYDGQLGRDHYNSNAVTGGVRISF